MTVSIEITLTCDAIDPDTGDICGASETGIADTQTWAREKARDLGWSSSRGLDRCPDCRKSGRRYPPK